MPIHKGFEPREVEVKAFTKVAVGTAGLLLSVSCGSDSTFGHDPYAESTIRPVVPAGMKYELVQEDTFDGPRGSALPPHWTPEVRTHGSNQELGADTARPENVLIDGEGHLLLIARKERYMGRDYTSARLNTQDKLEITYGKIEAVMKMPEGRGFWPAFWLLGENIDKDGWPECGEVDILEFRGENLFEMRGSLHGPGYSAGENLGRDFDTGVDLSAGFHTYGIVWSKQGVSFEFDGKPYFSALKKDLVGGREWVFDHPFFLILNLAVGGTYLDEPDETTPFPSELTIDTVRVYRLVEP